MALDQEKWIGAQAIMKSLIEKILPVENLLDKDILEGFFKRCMKIMEDYATIPEGEEFINTGIEIPKQYWNLPNNLVKQDWATEWGKPMKVEGKGWYLFCRGKDLPKLKQVFDGREDSFQEMLKTKGENK